MISFGQIEARARTQYEAESTTRWSPEAFLESANDGLDELSAATRFYERNVPVPLAGGQTYYDLRGYVPQSVVSINSIFNTAEQIWLTPADIGDLITPRWETVTGSPQKFLVRGLYWFGVYPRPSSDVGLVRAYYSSMAPHFRDAYSVIPDIGNNEEFVAAMVDYILYDLSVQDGETEKSLSHWDDYVAREKTLAEFIKNRITTVRSGRLAGR